MTEVALSLRGVRKRYGKTVALDGLDLDVPRGAIFGLVGPNGAGKTTTFGIASGAVCADEGLVQVLGDGPFDARVHGGRVAVLPQDCELSPFSSARQLLVYYARLSGLSRRAAEADAHRVLSLVRLEARRDAKVRQLSHGMRRRLAVAQALLGDPELVLLDEPTGGLDPHLVVEMRDLLRAQCGHRTLVVSTHILSDVEAVCDHVAFVDAGRCVRAGRIEEVTGRRRLVRIRIAPPPPDMDALASTLAGRSLRLEDDELCYTLDVDENPNEVQPRLLATLLAEGVRVLEVRLGDSLESAYLQSRAST